MYITNHAQERLYERTGLFMFKCEIDAFVKKANRVKGVNKRMRRVNLCGHQVDFICVKSTVVTTYARRLK